MAMSINTNMGSLRAQQAATNVSNDMQQSRSGDSCVCLSSKHYRLNRNYDHVIDGDHKIRFTSIGIQVVHLNSEDENS